MLHCEHVHNFHWAVEQMCLFPSVWFPRETPLPSYRPSGEPSDAPGWVGLTDGDHGWNPEAGGSRLRPGQPVTSLRSHASPVRLRWNRGSCWGRGVGSLAQADPTRHRVTPPAAHACVTDADTFRCHRILKTQLVNFLSHVHVECIHRCIESLSSIYSCWHLDTPFDPSEAQRRHLLDA